MQKGRVEIRSFLCYWDHFLLWGIDESRSSWRILREEALILSPPNCYIIMKKLLTGSAFALLLVFMAVPEAHAQTDIDLGVRGSYELDDVEAFALGAGLRISTPTLPIAINPTFDYYFVDDNDDFASIEDVTDVSLMQFTVNALYEFGFDNAAFTPYAGPGLSVVRWSVNDESETDVGLNLVGGAQFNTGSLRPFVEAHFVVGGDIQPAAITAGLRFNLN